MSDLAVVLLAAGASSRTHPIDKLAYNHAGTAMLRHAALTLIHANIGNVYVVLGGAFLEDRIRLLEGLNVHILAFESAHFGMGASLAFGVSKLPPSTKSVMIALADMPKLSSSFIETIAKNHHAGRITAPQYRGKIGHPVIFDQMFFPDLKTLKGDQGGRKIIADNRHQLTRVKDEDGISVFDIDIL